MHQHSTRQTDESPRSATGGRCSYFLVWSLVCGLFATVFTAKAADLPAVSHFRKDIQPILSQYCYDCHGDGEAKGEVAFDKLKLDPSLTENHDLWLKVIKNVRAGLMPPGKKARPAAAELKRLENWVKYDAFAIDPANPDPGRITVRRLNRIEYHNTIRDLLGVDFNTEVEFPADDTGYGFDNIGDVLTLSPMLLEKYLTAAKTIVTESVPTVARIMPEELIPGSRFKITNGMTNRNNGRGGKDTMLSLSYYDPATARRTFHANHAGNYKLALNLVAKGNFNFDPGKCEIVFKVDDHERLKKEFGWYDNKAFKFDIDEKFEEGDHTLSFELKPLTSQDKRINSLDMRIASVVVQGPMATEFWDRPRNYDRFFPHDAPEKPADRRVYAAELLGKFARQAFRRPVEKPVVDRYVKLSESVYSQPGKTFEAGIAQAMIAILASPRFLFRLEEFDPKSPAKSPYALVDEYSLASRLSYFLWSTMPDDTLMSLAERGGLRRDLTNQVQRMLADPKSEQMVQNFVGQWLQTRDLQSITINARAVLARDSGAPPQQRGFGGRRQPPKVELDRDLRNAMEKETTMFFSSIVHDNRSVTRLIESDYTFLNEKLAKVYGITNITGTEMRKVTLPPDSLRGGILTDGSVLVVTSNPDRTSPVKRGLFILDNILGTPTAPPPPNIPSLEASEKDFKDHPPTLREALAVHRDKPLCSPCHARMDPIGLAFENFNALGMFRDKERGQVIETPGKLVTGETFDTVRELKHILATDHREDFYRCLTAKFLTFALGRGPEYYDLESIDQIVNRLNQENGRFSALLMGVIESAPFQKQRKKATEVADAEPKSETRLAAKSSSKP